MLDLELSTGDISDNSSGTSPEIQVERSPSTQNDLDRWMRSAATDPVLPVDAIARAMEADGYGANEARMLAALGLFRHHERPLEETFEDARLQDAAWFLIRHFAEARRDAARENMTAEHAAPLSPRELNASSIQLRGRSVAVRLRCRSPELLLFDDLLSEEECRGLIDFARESIRPSKVMGEGDALVDASVRSSSGAFFGSGSCPLIELIESRVSELVSWPTLKMENLEITRYLPGEQFQPHLDYFHAGNSYQDQAINEAGQRIATVVIYLSGVRDGGGTVFEVAGLEVRPKQGSALYFSYQLPDGSTDAASLHAGAPVREGEKWIATLWLRERPLPYREPTGLAEAAPRGTTNSQVF